MYSQLFTDLTEQGVPRAEAHERARTGAALSAAGTALLTMGFGATGKEALFNKGAQETFKSRARSLAQGFLKEGAEELPEETLDQLWQGVIDQQIAHPDKPLGEIVSESLQAGFMGFVLGGSMATTSTALQSRTPQPLPTL